MSGPSELELATPETRVPFPAALPVPEHVLLVKKVKVTVPVGVPAPVPDTVAWSVTVEPRAAPVTATPPSCTVVTVMLLPWPTVKGSQDPVEPR